MIFKHFSNENIFVLGARLEKLWEEILADDEPEQELGKKSDIELTQRERISSKLMHQAIVKFTSD